MANKRSDEPVLKTGEDIANQIYFYKGSKNQVEDVELLKFYYEVDDKLGDKLEDEDYQLLYIQNEIKKVFQVRNLSLLLGAGCSSLIKEGEEKGIPAISGITAKCYEALSEEEKKYVLETIKLKIEDEPYKNNIEKTIEVLQSFRFYLKSTKQNLTTIDKVLERIKSKIYEICTSKSNEVIDVYQRFFRRIFLRDRSLNTVNIITPNYDLFNEIALEKLGINYSNGFSGYQERYFSPSTFNHVYAEDIGNLGKRLSPIENFAYLLKLHGSVSWFESNDSAYGLYNTKEIRPEADGSKTPQLDELMIYPSPMKQNASLGSPYSDIFREFQKRIMQDENLLLTIGYSFSDAHINNIIYQALSSSRFRLVIFGSTKDEVKKLLDMDDPRIWIIGGTYKGNKIHYFSEIANTVLKSPQHDIIVDKIQKSAAYLRTKENE